MPENIRALILILVLAMLVFSFASRYTPAIINAGDFTRRRNLWLALTIVAFLTLNFWVYVFVAILLLLYSNRVDSNPPAVFFFILFALPTDLVEVPGLGLFQSLFHLSHTRLLVLVILLPVFFSLRRQSDYLPFGRSVYDKVLAAFLLLSTVVYFRDSTTMTDALRSSFYLFLDVFLPYVVFSRSVKSLPAFRDVLLSFVLAVMVLALIASVEFYKHWLLYDTLILAIQGGGEFTKYLGRDGMLRVSASSGHPIVLGYLMVVGLGFYLFLQQSIKNTLMRRLGMGLLVVGLIAPLSRGPWVGAAVMIVVFIATSRYATRRLISLGLVSILLLSLISILPGGEKVINLLPFVGSTEKDNIEYREKLISNSMIVIQRNFWFGSGAFLKSPEMEAMRQGQGIIDIVNHYIGVTLKLGVVGLGLFVGFFALILTGIYRGLRSISDKDSEVSLLGRALLATLLAILVIIITASSITFIPIVYWSVAGLGVAYVQMVRKSSFRT